MVLLDGQFPEYCEHLQSIHVHTIVCKGSPCCTSTSTMSLSAVIPECTSSFALGVSNVGIFGVGFDSEHSVGAGDSPRTSRMKWDRIMT